MNKLPLTLDREYLKSEGIVTVVFPFVIDVTRYVTLVMPGNKGGGAEVQEIKYVRFNDLTYNDLALSDFEDVLHCYTHFQGKVLTLTRATVATLVTLRVV